MTGRHERKSEITASDQGVLCLAYHDVVPDGWTSERLSPSVTSYFVELSRFRQQMEWLAAVSSTWSLEQVKDWLADGLGGKTGDRCRKPKLFDSTARRRPAVHVSFDDGWAGSVYRAAPVLQQLGLSATLFVTTGLVGRPGFISRKTLKELDSSVFQVGAHGHTHRLLDQLPRSAVRWELIESKRRLEDWTGRSIDALSLPGGAASREVLEIAVETGFRYVFTSRPAVNMLGTSPLDIARIAVKGNLLPAVFERYLQGRLGPEALAWQVRRSVRLLLGERRYEWLRRKALREKRGQLDMTDLLAARVGSEAEQSTQPGLPPSERATSCSPTTEVTSPAGCAVINGRPQ